LRNPLLYYCDSRQFLCEDFSFFTVSDVRRILFSREGVWLHDSLWESIFFLFTVFSVMTKTDYP